MMADLYQITPSTYATFQYHSLCWIGIVCTVEICQSDIKINFMHLRSSSKIVKWLESHETCFLPTKNILCIFSSPTRTRGRAYKNSNEEYQRTITLFECMKREVVYSKGRDQTCLNYFGKFAAIARSLVFMYILLAFSKVISLS